MSVILRTEGLSKNFNGLQAVNEVDFTVEESELRAIIGPNGAGKTTFFNLLSGTFPPTAGRIQLRGEDVTDLPSYRLVDHGIARSFQISNLFEGLTVRENIRVGLISTQKNFLSPKFFLSDIRRDKELDEQTGEIARQVDLEEDVDKLVEELAHGQKRKLEIGISLSTDPDLLLLDEPAAGLTTEETRELMDTIRSVAERRTVLLIEHDMEFVLGISDSISVLHKGEILAEGTPAEVRNDRRVQEVYLGEE